MSNKLLVLFALIFCAAPVHAQEPEAFSFSGQVQAGQSYTHALSGDLLFTLTPSDKGWQIEVRENANSSANLAAVTLPLHGVNATQLEGWHFRNADNTSANDGSTNAPQEVRDFSFVTSSSDLDTVMEYYDCLMRGGEDMACREPAPLRWGDASLQITNYALTPYAKGDQAAFTSLTFTLSGQLTTKHRILP